MQIRPIILGATGMVGEGVLHEALLHPRVDSVLVLGRRSCAVQHPKLREIVRADLFNLSGIEQDLRGYDACFFCLGVSSIGMKESDYSRVTYDLTMQTARTLARLNPDMTFCYVSGLGTDNTEKGRRMWARVKGRTENDLGKLPFKAVYLFRPGFIKPISGLRNAFFASRILGTLYPLWSLLLPGYVCTLEDVGQSMIESAMYGYSRRVLENRDIALLARTAAARVDPAG